MTEARALLRVAEERLAEAGVASPGHDAAELLADLLDVQRTALPLLGPVPAGAEAAFAERVRRRAAREPLQHITGRAYFRHVELAVGPGVFVPRPETELLAGWALDRAAEVAAEGRTPVVVDLCTGSGAIALSLADELGRAAVPARLHAVELDPPAHAWAARNLAGTDVDLRQGDMAEAFPDLDGTVDVVVCNPPYVPLEAWESVAAEARDHDPHLALFSGDDGLDALRVLEATAARLLRPGGWVGAEHADVQGESSVALFVATGRWSGVRDHRDLAGRARHVTARLAP